MSQITMADAARRLARAIASDIALYNNEKMTKGLATMTPFLLIKEELSEGFELFKSRVSSELWSSFAPAALPILLSVANNQKVIVPEPMSELAQALGKHAQDAGALLQYNPQTPQSAQSNVTRIKVQQGLFDEVYLVLSPGLLRIEPGATSGITTHEEHKLSDIKQLKVQKNPDGKIELRAEISFQEKSFTFPHTRELTKVVLHLLDGFDG